MSEILKNAIAKVYRNEGSPDSWNVPVIYEDHLYEALMKELEPYAETLRELLWELPAEFYDDPAVIEERQVFSVIKRSNVRKVHVALWRLQGLLGVHRDRDAPVSPAEPVSEPPACPHGRPEGVRCSVCNPN